MPLTSMTGFGRATASRNGVRVDVEISTVNRKQFDARIALPRMLAVLEAKVQLLLAKRIARGQVVVNVRLKETKATGAAAPRVDRAAAAEAVKTLRRTAAALGLPDNLGADILLQLPGVVVASDEVPDVEALWPAMQAALVHALDALLDMRHAEGANLARDLRQRLKALGRIRAEIVRRAPAVQRAYGVELRKRVAAAGLPAGRNDPQLLKELLFYIDRSDVTEELVRLKSHLSHALDLMGAAKPVGRSLDFLCQELFREINTVGAKSSDARLARMVVAFKSQLEAVREQVQNVE